MLQTYSLMVQNLTNNQITLLEIYMNSYKHFRIATSKRPTRAREAKAQKRTALRFSDWLHKTLTPEHQLFLLPYGLIEVMAEVKRFIDTRYPTPNTQRHELQVLQNH